MRLQHGCLKKRHDATGGYLHRPLLDLFVINVFDYIESLEFNTFCQVGGKYNFTLDVFVC